MAQLNSWQDLYKELAQILSDKVPGTNWVDLWHNQINFLSDEHLFTAPAAFISFRMISPEDKGDNIQDANVQVDIYYFFETFADTFEGSFNQSDALDYLNALTDIHKALHGTSGETYSSMRRMAMAPVDTGSAGNLYRISFTCLVTDISAANVRDEATPGELTISQGEKPGDGSSPPLFDV
jgi:hypothetical protein